MLVLGIIAVGVAAIALFSWWAYRRWNQVDSYHERDYKDPPVTDAGSWFGGDR